jgi:hypothetical protein
VLESSVTAARQEFLRSELADWDASARSRLSQADKALAVQLDQYLLIVKNILFSDPLSQNQATMTLGLNEIAATKEICGTHWSLCLSHLRYYDDPVQVESVENRTSATVSQFRVIVLGAVLESWQVPVSERLDAVRWIDDLWGYLQRTAPINLAEISLCGHTSWLAVLGVAAYCIVSSTGSQLEHYEDCLSHGEMWGGNFFQYGNLLDPLKDQRSHNVRPYFGICNPTIMGALHEPLDVDCWLRIYARDGRKHEVERRAIIVTRKFEMVRGTRE